MESLREALLFVKRENLRLKGEKMKVSSPYNQQVDILLVSYIECSRPEWCVSSMIYSRDTPFWLETLDICLSSGP